MARPVRRVAAAWGEALGLLLLVLIAWLGLHAMRIAGKVSVRLNSRTTHQVVTARSII
jgi:hypothetical protein